MMPVFYMTPDGVWACSCQTEADKPNPTLIPAPEGGGDGQRWDGAAWVAYAPPPDSCTALQGRLALGEARYEQIAAMLPHMPWAARQAWEYAQSWQRKSALLVSLAATFGMTEAEVDDLFRLAVTLEV